MKIGILVWQLDIKGGTQRQVLELARYLSMTNHKVVIYAYLFDKEGCYPELCEGLDIRYVKLNRDSTASDYPSRSVEYFYKYWLFFWGIKHKQLLRIIDDDIDVLNPHDSGTYVTAGLWREKYKRPVVWMMNDMPLYKWNTGHLPKTIGYHFRSRYRKYIQKFDKIIVLDNLNRNLLMKNFHMESVVVRSGLDINSFRYVERGNKQKYTIFMLSVLFPHRRVEDGVLALSHLNSLGHDVSIEHVGALDRDKRYTRKIKRLVKRLGLEDRVRFHGPVSHDRLLQFFQRLDIFLFPNNPQTWGLSVFEAMASGMPVVPTAGCGAAEILTDGENAVIVDPNSPQQIARAIARLISNQKFKDQLARNAYDFVSNNISWERYSKELLTHLEAVYRQ